MKPVWKSWTVRLNLALLALARLKPEWAGQVCQSPEMTIQAIALLNVLLRLKSKTGVRMRRLKKAPLVVLSLLLASCSSVHQKLDADTLYARTMEFKINGAPFVGTAVVAKAAAYDIEIQSRNNMDLVTIKSCARNWWGEKVGSGGGILFWKKDNKFTYHYEPDSDLEMGKECPLEIAAYDATSGAHSWGLIDFDWSGDWSLPADVTCNAVKKQTGGVSICQNSKGLQTRFAFPVDVIWSPKAGGDGCGFAKEEFLRGKEFVFALPPGVCHWTFMETGAARRRHRTSTVGYSDIVVQEQQ